MKALREPRHLRITNAVFGLVFALAALPAAIWTIIKLNRKGWR